MALCEPKWGRRDFLVPLHGAIAGVIENTPSFAKKVILLLGGIDGSTVENLKFIAINGVEEKRGRALVFGSFGRSFGRIIAEQGPRIIMLHLRGFGS